MPPTPQIYTFPEAQECVKNRYFWSPNAGKTLPNIFENHDFRPPRHPFPPFSIFSKPLPTTSHLSHFNPNPPPIISNFHPRTCPESNRAPPSPPIYQTSSLSKQDILFCLNKTYFLFEQDIFSVSRRHIFCVRKIQFLCEEDIFLFEEDTVFFEKKTYSFGRRDIIFAQNTPPSAARPTRQFSRERDLSQTLA